MRSLIERARLSGGEPGEGREIVFHYRFDEGESLFKGHFPGRPLLPGIFQLEMVREAAGTCLGGNPSIRAIVKSKFTRPILPGETIRLVLLLEDREDGTLARARFSVNEEAAGETRLLLG